MHYFPNPDRYHPQMDANFCYQQPKLRIEDVHRPRIATVLAVTVRAAFVAIDTTHR